MARRKADDAIDDLLGFGRPKKAAPQPEPAPEPVKKEAWVPAKKDTFIDDVKKTNRIVNKK